jgi:penicillin-binding protein 1A
MLAKIKEKYTQGKSFFSRKLNAIGLLLLAGAKKVLGERIYSICVGYTVLGQVFVQTQTRKIQKFYEAKVDKTSPYYKPVVRIYRVFFKTSLFVLIYLFVVETNFFFLTGEMPSVDDLQNPKLSQASEIYSADGVLLGKFFAENRTPIRDFKQISPYLVKALVATEDARFYQHTGIDFQAWAGVLVGIVKGGDRGGGSTISQQLAKNLFKTRTKKGFAKTGLLGYIPGLNKLIYKSK